MHSISIVAAHGQGIVAVNMAASGMLHDTALSFTLPHITNYAIP